MAYKTKISAILRRRCSGDAFHLCSRVIHKNPVDKRNAPVYDWHSLPAPYKSSRRC